MASAGPLPRYIQLSEMLIREIAAGRLLDGDRLPPERQMASEHGVSVGTLRKALSDLESKGLLQRRQGSGNYIKGDAEGIGIYAFLRLEAPGGGGLPTAEVLSLSRQAKPTDAPDFGPSAEGHRIRRLRSLDGHPAAMEEIWLDGAATPEVKRTDLSESLYQFYRDRLGVVIARVEDRIATAPVPKWADPRFAPEPGATVGFIERISWAQTGARIEYSRTWFDGKRARYVSRLGQGMAW